MAESIRLQILVGELKPGDRLPNENDLAREQGVGRTTVREALRLLASARLIETRRGVQGGAFVTRPNSEDLADLMLTALSLMTMNGELADDELVEANRHTMPTIARLAASRGTDEEIDRLETLAASLANARTDDEWVDVGREFNNLLIHMSRSRVLALFIRPMMWIAPTRHKELRQVAGWREATAPRYRELADAVSRRAPAASAEAMLRVLQCYAPYRSKTGADGSGPP